MTRWYVGAIVALISLVLWSAWWIQYAEREIRIASAEDWATVAVLLDSVVEHEPQPTHSARPALIGSNLAARRSAPRKPVVWEFASSALLLNLPEHSATEDIEIVQTLLDFFRRANAGANPSGGLNEEFVDQLRGKNSIGIAVLPTDLPAIDDEGRLLDRWKTPYFFHPVSAKEMEIRSAGPDRKLWTDDDVF